jgi:putative membrane protein
LKNILLILLVVIVITISALFFAQNDGMVEIKYFGGSVEWQMNWVLISALALGFVLGLASILGSWLTTKIKLANGNRRLAVHRKEIKNLRALPIKDEY